VLDGEGGMERDLNLPREPRWWEEAEKGLEIGMDGEEGAEEEEGTKKVSTGGS
jgi:hypothetical protein